MKNKSLLLIALIAISFPVRLHAQEGPKISGFVQGLYQGDMNSDIYGSTDYYTVGVNYWPLKSLNFKLDYSLVQKVVGERTNSHRVVGILSYTF